MMQTRNVKLTSDSIPATGPAGGVARMPPRLSLRLTVSLGDAGCARVPAAAFDLLRWLPRLDSRRGAASGFGLYCRHTCTLTVTRRSKGTRLKPDDALLAAALEGIESRLVPELDAATQAMSAALAPGAGENAQARP